MATIFEKQTITLYPDEGFGGLCAGDLSPGELIDGESYDVYFDGAKYTCKAEPMAVGSFDGIGLGNKAILGIGGDSGEPFIIGNVGSIILCFSAETVETTHEVGLYEHEETEEPEPLEGVVVKDFNGKEQTYSGITAVILKTSDGGTQIFSQGEAVENVPITLDFSRGDMNVQAKDNTLMKSVVIETPEGLIPENIKKDEVVAGIVGTHEGGGGNSEASILSEEPWLDDVCFWDLEGNLIQNITMNQIKNLTELPTAPTYDNMIFEGWNHTLEEIKTTEYPLDVAPIYSTADGKTHIKLTPIGTSYLDFKFNFTQTVENGVAFDFGDGSAPQTVAGTGAVSITHTFSSVKEYDVAISVSNGCVFGLGGGSSSLPLATKSTSTSSNSSYSSAIIGIIVADGVELNQYAIYSMKYLKFVSLPKTLTVIPNYNFNAVHSIKCISLPPQINEIQNYSIRSIGEETIRGECIISIPQSLESVGTAFLSVNYHIKRIVVPKSIVSASTSCLSSFYNLKRAFVHSIAIVKASFLSSCRALNKFEFPAKLAEIPNNVLSYSKIRKMVIPSSVTTIGNDVFNYSAINELYIPSSVTTIGNYFCECCYSLQRVIVEDGSTLVSVGTYSFQNCSPRELIFLSETPPTYDILKKFCYSSIWFYSIYVPDKAIEAYITAFKYASIYNSVFPLSKYYGTIPNNKD